MMNKTNLSTERLFPRRQLIKLLAGSVGVAGLSMILPACSNAGPVYYTLSSHSGKTYRNAPRIIEVRTPSLAGSLDRDRIVSERNVNQLDLAVNATWSENLASMISRVMTLNLAQRLPDSHVFAQNQATSMKPEAFVEMDISRFNHDVSGRAVATVSLVIYRDGQQKSAVTRLLQLEEMPQDQRLISLVVALDVILAKISDDTAQILSALPWDKEVQE